MPPHTSARHRPDGKAYQHGPDNQSHSIDHLVKLIGSTGILMEVGEGSLAQRLAEPGLLATECSSFSSSVPVMQPAPLSLLSFMFSFSPYRVVRC